MDTKHLKTRKIIALVLLASILVFGGFKAFQVYFRIFSPNVFLPGDENVYLYIPTGSTFEDVRNQIIELGILKDIHSFDWVAEKKNFGNHVKPGKYQVVNKMNNNELVNMLRSGEQEPVKLLFNALRTIEKLCGIVSSQIEADSLEILQLLNDEGFLSEYGFPIEYTMALFIPNTYEVYWNSSAGQFIERMVREYKRFWTEERKRKAEEIGFTPLEVSTLASIIDEETNKNDEKPAIAGVYLNRLARGIPLQACPTLRYATGDYTIRRVLLEHMEIESPYNTYKYRGLPPGPISIPSIAAIEAVLNAEKHDYYYFCARADLSGYHHFSKTLAEHNRYARLYQQVLDEQRILK